MTKGEFILANFCFGSPLLSGSYPKTPSTTKSPQHLPVWNRWEGSPQIKYLCRDHSCFSKENTTHGMVFKSFPPFTNFWFDYKQFWCRWHSRKVLFWLHNWICQIGSLTPHPWPVCPKHGHHDDDDVDDEDELQGLKDCPKAILRFEECALARGGKMWNSWYYNCANFTELVLIFCFFADFRRFKEIFGFLTRFFGAKC